MEQATGKEYFRIEIDPDRTKAVLRFNTENVVSGEISLNKEEMLRLVQTLGKANQILNDGSEIPVLEGQRIEAIYNTRWFVNPEMLGEASALSFHHPAYGPLGFLIPIDQVPQLIELLTNQVAVTNAQKSAPQ